MSDSTSNNTSSANRPIGLILVNAILLVALAFVTFASTSTAQSYRAHGSYLAVPGNIPGWDAAAIYVIDQTNEQMIALTYDPNNKTLNGVGARDLASDAIQFGARN